MSPSPASPRIGYVISRYPMVSHTFVQREVVGLRAAGFDIETFAVTQADPAEILSPQDRTEAERTINLRPVSASKVLRHLVRPVLRHPGAVLGALRVAGRRWWTDPRQLLWRVFYLAEAVMLWSLSRRAGVGHLHAHHANVASDICRLAVELSRRTGEGPTTWSFTMHGSSEFVDVDRHDLGTKVESAAGVACISHFTRSQLMMVSDPSSWDRMSVVRCGVDVERFSPTGRMRNGNEFTVMFIGRLASEKGLPVLVEAMGLLHERMPEVDLRLLVVGDGELRPQLQQQCAAMGIRAEFAGAVGQHEIMPYWHRADAVCLTSFREGVPVVLMEAMACEIPCVAPAVGAIGELIESGESGLIATAGRADAFADALQMLVADPGLASRLGKAGRERVLAEFTTTDTIRSMVAFFDDVFAAAPAVSPSRR